MCSQYLLFISKLVNHSLYIRRGIVSLRSKLAYFNLPCFILANIQLPTFIIRTFSLNLPYYLQQI